MRTLITSLFLVVLCLSMPAEANKKKQVRKTQEINFDGIDIDGKAKNPDAAYLNQRKGVEFLPVYKVRTGFETRVKESIEYMR